MLAIVWCFFALLLSMVLTGLAVRGFLARGKPLDEAAWLQVPFIGIAVTVLALQTQVYLEIPVNRGVLAFWAVIASLGVVWLWRGSVQASIRNLPMLPTVVCGAVLMVECLGLVRVGLDDYVGRTWSDQLNYTVMAEFFRVRGFTPRLEETDHEVWLVRLESLRHLRLGQSILQAYHGVITRMATRTQFMPTILLACPLIAVALYAAARNCGLQRRHAAMAAFFGGLVPGVTMLVQESFLSNALAIPFFLMLPTLLSAYNRERNIAALGTAVLCLGALASIYTEFLILELLMVGAFLVLALAQRPRGAWHSLGYLVLLAAPWLCNPLNQGMSDYLSPALSRPGVLTHIYPWAYDEIGLGVLWFGDRCLELTGQGLAPWAIAVGNAVVAAGALGLLMLAASGVARWWQGRRQLAHGGFDMRLCFAGLAVIPATMILRDHDHHYQYYKLLVTISPLVAFGMVFLTVLLGRVVSQWQNGNQAVRRLIMVAIWLPGLTATAVAAGGSGRIAWHSGDPERYLRSQQYIALDPDFCTMRQELEGIKGQNILFRPSHHGSMRFHQIWGLYFARRNQVWLAYPFHNDDCNLESIPSLAHFTDLTNLPAPCLVVCPRDSVFLLPPRSSPAPEIVWQNPAYTIWRYDGRPWACITHVDNPNTCECHAKDTFWLGGGESVVRIWATAAGTGNLRVFLHNGPCIDPLENIRLRVKYATGRQYDLEISAGSLQLPLELQPGFNTLRIEVLNPLSHPLGHDPRPLLASMQIDDLEFQPQSALPTQAGSLNGS